MRQLPQGTNSATTTMMDLCNAGRGLAGSVKGWQSVWMHPDGDIYLLNRKLLPVFDVVTLFHRCEFRGDKNDAYGAMTDLDLVNLLTDHARPGGYLLFFPGSFAFDRADHSAKDVIAEWGQQRAVEKLGRYKSLLVYRKLEGGR